MKPTGNTGVGIESFYLMKVKQEGKCALSWKIVRWAVKRNAIFIRLFVIFGIHELPAIGCSTFIPD